MRKRLGLLSRANAHWGIVPSLSRMYLAKKLLPVSFLVDFLRYHSPSLPSSLSVALSSL